MEIEIMAKFYLIIEKLRIPLSRVFAVILIGFIAISTSAWEDSRPAVSTLFFVIGVLLVAIASLGRMWCSLYIAGYKTEVLVTQGPYSVCRNPLYFFSLIGAIGVGFASETILIPFILFIIFMLYYPLVIHSEEKELRSVHKEQFEKYAAVTPKFFPRLSGLTEPEKYIVNPIIYRKHIFSALWFVWLVGILEIIEELHELRMLPVLFKIY